jgi:CHASE2 domain
VRGQEFKQESKSRWETRRILFSLPNASPVASENVPYIPWLLESVDAHEVGTRLEEGSLQIEGRVVIIGGSYFASGDLHPTPLGTMMPGAMVHANAMKAFSEPDGVIRKPGPLIGPKFCLVSIAALIGASISVLADSLKKRGKPWSAAIVQLLGSCLAVWAVFWVAVQLAYSGAGGAALIPALLIAFENFFGIIGRLEHGIETGLEHLIDSGVSLRARRTPDGTD